MKLTIRVELNSGGTVELHGDDLSMEEVGMVLGWVHQPIADIVAGREGERP